MKKLNSILLLLLFASCGYVQKTYTYQYKMSPPIIVVDKTKFLGRYELCIQDSSSNFYIIDGNSKYLKYLYKNYQEGDTIKCKELILYKN